MAKMTFQFLDVGMGDGTLVIMGNTPATQQLALIDLGVQPYTKFKVGAKDTMVYLVDTISAISKERGKEYPYLDHLFITHPDQDHYNLIMTLIKELYDGYGLKDLKIGALTYGGAKGLYKGEIERISPHVVDKSSIFDRPSLDYSKVDAIEHSVEPNWRFASDEIKVYLLNVNYPSVTATAPNPLSLCLMFADQNDHKVIFIGDGEAEVEKQIIYNFRHAGSSFLNAYALKLGHHGAKKGTCNEWLKAVKPKAVFASGDMVWAHPYCETIERVEAAKTLGTTHDHWYCCGKYIREDDAESGNEYFNRNKTLSVCLNLWYVVKSPTGEYMKNHLNKVSHSKQGVTFGVQWELEFDGGAAPSLAWTDTYRPA
jgi:competence protein ComEC